MGKGFRVGLVCLVMAAGAAPRSLGDAARIQGQFVDYYVSGARQASAATRNMTAIQPDGTWGDIDYASQRRGGWPTLSHLRRLEGMAVVYADPAAKLYQAPELKRAVVSGLGHWLENDYRNPNWWYARIGVPQSLGATMLLLGEDLPDEIREKARPILMRSTMGLTGQNKVWCAGNNVMMGLLYDEPERVETASAAIWSELRVSTEEGIQPDWSFHQHGPQQQFGNYGLSFAGDMIKWAAIFRGTEFELSGEQLQILRNYLLEGASWVVWKWKMDLSACGRQIDAGAQRSKGASTMRQVLRMVQVDPSNAEKYYRRHDFDEWVGFKPFWRSEMAVQRRPGWYASVKMSSTRVVGAETCNSENMRGLHLGDGVLLTYLSGGEYEDIVPVWDWKRLPGTTCDQGMDELAPKGASKGYGGSGFSGVLGDGTTGVAAMIYRRADLSARKAWFFLEDEIVCLGAGISGTTEGNVMTSIQQSWADGDLLKGDGWIHHAGIGYVAKAMRSSVQAVEGNWLAAYPTRGDRPASGTVFSAWFDHGASPENATYAYRVLPNVPAGEMEALVARPSFRVIAQTEKVLAVQSADGLWAVFFEAGRVKTTAGKVIAVDAPCLLMIKDGRAIVSDPRHALDALTVTIGGKRKTIPLPSGVERGQSVEVGL